MGVAETKYIESSWESKGDECYPVWKFQWEFLDIDGLLKESDTRARRVRSTRSARICSI